MWNPDYPNVVLSFNYRGFTIQIDQSQSYGQAVYAAWAKHDQGCAMATPFALSRAEAVKKAKRWVDQRVAADSQ